MNLEQYDHWKDFALRMARVCYAASRRPSRQWIENTVADFFDSIEELDVPCIVSWDDSTVYPEGHPWHGKDFYGRPNEPYCVGDMVSLFLSEDEGYPPACRACREYEYEGKCRCDEIAELYYEQWREQWGGPIHCCIRAGLDLASAPSAGVMGFTAGDVRKMYPEGVPDWAFPPGGRLRYWPDGELNGTFAELNDAKEIVL